MTDVADGGALCAACGATLSLADRFCAACGHAVEGFGPARDPLIGAVVAERYRVLSRIGTGGMGAVYAVEHVRIGKVAALKLLHAELSRDEAMVRRFTREARAVSRLSSPYTVSVFDSGRSNGLVFLVMELLRGHDLAAELDRYGPIAVDRVVRIVRMIAASLAEAHALGIVHRDIKPQNVFLCESGADEHDRIKVLDFGLAKLVGGRDDSQAVTHAGTVLGTPYYMAPEQIADGAIDHRCDIYSLAALAWCLLTGAPPYRHSTALGVLNMHVSAPVPQLAGVMPELGPLQEVFARGLAKRPDERFDRVDQFAAALTDAARSIAPPLGGKGADQALRARRVDAEPAMARGESQVMSGLRRGELVGTREEFDRYERSLRAQRAARVFAGLALSSAVVAAAAWLGAGGMRDAARDREPNDDLALAVPLQAEASVVGSLRRDSSQLGPDRDVFSIVLPEGGDHVVHADVTGLPGVDVVLELADGTGRYLARSDAASAGGAERIVAAQTPDRRAFIVVRSDAEGGAELNVGTEYTLRAGIRERYLREEHEPNDMPYHATPVGSGDVRVGLIGVAGDADVYSLPPGEGATRVSLRSPVDLDLQLSRTSNDGAVLELVDARGFGGSEQLDIGPNRASPTWIRVTAASAGTSPLAYFVTFEPVEGADVPRTPP